MDIFSFKGRARRTEWWLIRLGTAFIYNIFYTLYKSPGEGNVVRAVILAVLKPVSVRYSPVGEGSVVLAVILAVVAIFVTWIELAINTRRCHDLGHNGFWQLIPFYGIWMGFVKGEERTNKYSEEVIQE